MNFYDFNKMRASFENKQKSSPKANNNINNDNSNTHNFSANNNDYSRNNDYFNKSQDELFKELNSAVDNMKSNGTFDIGAIESFYTQASAFLSDEQRARMRLIIDMLKGDK